MGAQLVFTFICNNLMRRFYKKVKSDIFRKFAAMK